MIFRNHLARLILALVLCSAAGWGCSVCLANKAPTKRPFVLVIDAGHGGKDAGAVGQLTKEKDINLNVALALGRLVEQNCPDVKVIYTRKTDVFVTLQGRADIANRNKAHLFISVHTNSSPPGKAAPMGAETYTLGMHRAADNLEVAKRENSVITQESNYKQTYHNFDPRKSESYIIFEFMQDRNMQQSVDLARAIQRHYTSSGRRNKGVHQAGFLVLRATSMPSVLTELGFISNPEEEKFLHSREGVETLARSIFEGFKAYRQKHYALEDVPTNASQEESEAQPLVAENDSPSATPSLENVRQSLTVPTPIDVASLKAEILPVPTRPFGQPAAMMPKTHNESSAAVPQPQLPQPLPSPAAAKDTLTKLASTAPLLADAQHSIAVSADSIATAVPTTPQLSEFVPQIPPTQQYAHTAQSSSSTHSAPTVSPINTSTQQQNTTSAQQQTSTAQQPTNATTKQTAASTKPTTATAKQQTATAHQQTATAQQPTTATTKQTAASTKQHNTRQQHNTEKKSTTSTKDDAHPVFKLQLFTTDHAMRSDDRHFKGLSPVEFYEEGGRYKYTYGATTSYEEAKRLQKEIADRFPEAFVVAFLHQQRTELSEAIRMAKAAPTSKK